MKVIFMGTPVFAVPVLKALIENYDVIGVVTQPDKEVGRKRVIKHSPIKELALEHKIKVMQPISIKNDYEEIINLKPDLIVTCAYGQFIPKEILEIKSINVHASLLPKLRGGAPIHWAIINGLEKTGVTIMEMSKKMDAGDILSQIEVKITKDDTMGTLHDKLMEKASILLIDTINNIDNIKPIKQDEAKVTFGYNIKREEELIDFNKSAKDIFNLIRGLNPHPGAYALLEDKRVKVWNSEIGPYKGDNPGEIFRICPRGGLGVATKDGEIILTEVQFEGKKRVLVKDYLNGVDQNKLLEKRFK